MAALITVEGLSNLRRGLKAAGLKMQDLTALNKAVAAIVVPVAQATAPVGPAKRGHINTTVRAGATTKTAVVRVGSEAKPYAPVIHFGWPNQNIRGNPWVSRAAQSAEGKWVDRYAEGIQQIVNKIEGA